MESGPSRDFLDPIEKREFARLDLPFIDEEAAMFMGQLPQSRRTEVWHILNSHMTHSEKMSHLEYDFNSEEVQLVEKWLRSRFFDDLVFQTLEIEDRKKLAALVTNGKVHILKKAVELYEIEHTKCSTSTNEKTGVVRSESVEQPHYRQLYLPNYTTYISFSSLFFIFLFVKIKDSVENSRTLAEFPVDWYIKGLLYTPCILFTLYYPFVSRQKAKHPSLVSAWLRYLTLVVSLLFTLYEVFFMFLCVSQWNGWTCSYGTLAERILELAFFNGLAVFVTHNSCYPRDAKFSYALLFSSAVFALICILINEEVQIYEEIVKDQNDTFEKPLHRNYSVKSRGYRFAEPIQAVFSAPKPLYQEYFEMCYVAISELLVVAASVSFAIIMEVGKKEKQKEWNSADLECNGNLWKKTPSPKTILIAFAAQLFLISWNVDPSDYWKRTIFLVIHLLVLIAGIVICLFSVVNLLTDEESNKKHLYNETPSETLDRYLLYFGTGLMLLYTAVGVVHLCSSALKEPLSLGTCLVYMTSIIQVAAQTLIILSRSRIRNFRGYNGKALWVVNFALFCLDLYDATTFGIYSMPVSKNSRLWWTMLVRGLGSFDVFYRFHSLAVIAENIEFYENLESVETESSTEKKQLMQKSE